jgi:hypothetical protein
VRGDGNKETKGKGKNQVGENKTKKQTKKVSKI